MVSHENKKSKEEKERKKENGAHKHRSHLKKLSAQNIHVMLSYAIIKKHEDIICPKCSFERDCNAINVSQPF